MLSRREKVLYAKFNTPVDVSDRYIFVGDDKQTVPDKKGNLITLAEHKKLYPYYLKHDVEVEIATTVRTIKFTIKKGYVWNGADIPRILWVSIGSQHNPEFKRASLVHDYMLEFKWELYVPPLSNEITIAEYRRLTSLGFRQFCKNDGVPTVKANVMSWFVQVFQTTVNRREWKPEEQHED